MCANAQSHRNSERNDTLSFWNRWSYRTNIVDWALMCPNVGVEFDVLPGDYNKWTVGIDAMYNWNTWESNVSSYVYDVAQVTLEGRRYFRTTRLGKNSDGTYDSPFDPNRHGLMRWLQYVFRTKFKTIRPQRAYYWGFYLSATQYSVKFNNIGRQGPAYSAGLSWGWGIPLYKLGKGTIDFDFGLRVGLVLTKSRAFTTDKENNCYPWSPKDDEDWHMVPYPIPTDIHVSLVYRPFSIRQKYRKSNFEQDRLDADREREIQNRRDSVRLAREAIRDSMLQVVKLRDDARKGLKRRKHIADSLKVTIEEVPLTKEELAYEKWCEETDAIENQKNAAKAAKRAEKEAAKRAKAEAKAAAKAAKDARKEQPAEADTNAQEEAQQ